MRRFHVNVMLFFTITPLMLSTSLAVADPLYAIGSSWCLGIINNRCDRPVPDGHPVDISNLDVVQTKDGPLRAVYFWGYVANAKNRVVPIGSVRLGTCWDEAIKFSEKEIDDPNGTYAQWRAKVKSEGDYIFSGEAAKDLLGVLGGPTIEPEFHGISLKILLTNNDNCDNCNIHDVRYVQYSGTINGRLLDSDGSILSGTNPLKIITINE